MIMMKNYSTTVSGGGGHVGDKLINIFTNLTKKGWKWGSEMGNIKEAITRSKNQWSSDVGILEKRVKGKLARIYVLRIFPAWTLRVSVEGRKVDEKILKSIVPIDEYRKSINLYEFATYEIINRKPKLPALKSIPSSKIDGLYITRPDRKDTRYILYGKIPDDFLRILDILNLDLLYTAEYLKDSVGDWNRSLGIISPLYEIERDLKIVGNETEILKDYLKDLRNISLTIREFELSMKRTERIIRLCCEDAALCIHGFEEKVLSRLGVLDSLRYDIEDNELFLKDVIANFEYIKGFHSSLVDYINSHLETKMQANIDNIYFSVTAFAVLLLTLVGGLIGGILYSNLLYILLFALISFIISYIIFNRLHVG